MNDSLNINKNEFGTLTEDPQLAKLTTPVYVPLTQNPDEETFPQKLERYKKFEKLPETVRYKLVDSKTSQKIQAIGKKYGFELLHLANITRLIREYYFGEVRLEDFPREIEKRMSVSLLTAQEIARYIKSEIIDWDPWAEYLAKLPKVSAREIVTKYPKVAEQEITDGYLEFKERPDDIFDPTIKNWLRDYMGHLGQTGHSSVDRMKYLFYSENAKGLSSPDREKLGIILKSFDENTPLPVDVENNEVIFDIQETTQPSSQSSAFPSRPDVTSGRDSSKPSFTKPQPETFIRPYPAFAKASADKPAAAKKPQIQPRPVQNKIPDTDRIQFMNPYPKPGTHEAPSSPEIAGTAPIKMKGFSEGTAASQSPPKPYVPRHPKNIIYPLSQSDTEEKPEPRIAGNIVDLSGQ